VLVFWIVQAFPGISLNNAGLAVVLLAHLATGLLVYGLCVRYVGKPRRLRESLVYAIIALVMLLVSPVTLLTPDNLYFGYIPITVYHNPTVTLLRPFALMLFVAALAIIESRTRQGKILRVVVGTVLSILATLAKPNFTVALLPPLLLVAAYQAVKRNWQTSAALLLGFMLPGAIILYAQMAFFAGGEGLAIAPFAVFNAWLDIFYPGNPLGLLPRLILSILFPAYICVAYRGKAFHNTSLNLAWATFGFGAVYTYFLAEAGARLTDGNWTWSGQITLFVLFTASILF